MLIHVQSSNIPIVRNPIANANCTSLLSTLLPAWKQRSVLVSCSRPNLMTFTNCTPYSSQRCTGVCSIIWWQSLIKTPPASRLRVQTNGAQLPWLQSPKPLNPPSVYYTARSTSMAEEDPACYIKREKY